MEGKRVVVIGGVAGGMSFATRYRRLNQNDHIIVLDKGPYVSFANCGLPYHISGEIEERSSLIVASKEMLANRFQLDVRTNHEVVSINPQNKTLELKNEFGDETLSYDKLVISVGGKPMVLDIPGKETHDAIFTLRNIPDMDAILEALNAKNPKSAIVIGAGFIGLEMAETLVHRGLKVSVVEKASHVLPPFDEEMATFVDDVLVHNRVKVYTNTGVSKIEGHQAILEDGTRIDADVIIMAVGVSPATNFLKDSGIELGMRGGILVDEFYQTSIDDIYAVGDAMIIRHAISGHDALISLAGPANRQGRHLADILSGYKKPNQGSMGTAIVRLFNKTFAMVGLAERNLNKDEIHVMHIKGNHHVSYIPGVTSMTLKVIFDKNTHRILGAQAAGEKGVDKRIDVIATAIRAGLKIQDLQELELSYAPPYGSAKDIINMAGFVGENLILGITNCAQWYEVKDAQKDENTLIIDVRSPEEYEQGHIESAINMPLDTLRCSAGTLSTDKQIIVYCASGVRSYNAEQILKSYGHKVRNLDGAYGLYAQIFKGSK